MNYELESEVWLTAQRVMPAFDLQGIVVDAIAGYRRRPGYSVLERVYASSIGSQSIEALREGLRTSGLLEPGDPYDFVSLRAPLRAHLFAALQWHLMITECASGAVSDGHFARDLGL